MSWTAWLIERDDRGCTEYFQLDAMGGLPSWVKDPLEAAHGCRRKDAEDICGEGPFGFGVYIRQHEFVDAAEAATKEGETNASQ